MKQLIVPVYLNQKIVFDLLAMLQDGISTVRAINTSNGDSSAQGQKLSAGFGLSEAFSTLLKIDLSGSKETSGSQNHNVDTNEEKVHTPASLFFKLKNLMNEQSHLHELKAESEIKAGDFIEFEGQLNRNPIIEVIDSMSEMMNIAQTFQTPEKTQNPKSQKQPQNEYKVIQQQMQKFSESLKAGNTIDLTMNNLSSGHNALITVETAFLNDPLMSDLVDGQFRVLGKVIKTVQHGETIDLLRKTAISKMPSPLLLQAFEHLTQLGTDGGFNIPEIRWNIEGPAFQVIPIAIYA